MADPINYIDPSGKIFEKALAKILSPNQQAIVSAGMLAIGTITAAEGVLGKIPLVAVVGGLLAYEGVQNYRMAQERGVELIKIPRLNDFVNRKSEDKESYCEASR